MPRGTAPSHFVTRTDPRVASPTSTQTKSLPSLPFSTVLIANRGEVAIRLIKACHLLNLRAAAVFVADDAASPHLLGADSTHSLGNDPSAYISVPALLAAAKAASADAVLPGYGFISEDPEAAAAFERSGIKWVGPRPETLQLFGLKHAARQASIEANVPTVPGSPVLTGIEHAVEQSTLVGFPALLKASAGGGGMGQAIVRSVDGLRRAYDSVVAQAKSLFGNSDVYLERYVERARHIEVQVFGDGNGTCIAIGDRDCSVQRRRQKVIEEGNAPNMGGELRNTLRRAAERLCGKHNYLSAGTVEFILDVSTNEWFFLEVNTRLQVEHGVTELVSGIDIVQWMLSQAGGIDVLEGGAVKFRESGVAIEARIYAENPAKDYVPCPGTLSAMEWPEEKNGESNGCKVRVDGWAQVGTVVPGHYDPLLGKVLAWGRTRPLAIVELKKALKKTIVRGVPSNVELLLQTTDHPNFLRGKYTTGLLNTFTPKTNSIEVVAPGLQSSLQDYPGRVGYWNIGVSPSGPMDAYAMGMANALVGNGPDACALEMTMRGPSLVFHTTAVVALAGGHFGAELDDGKPVQFWTPFIVKKGSVLYCGSAVARRGEEEDWDGETRPLGGKIAYIAVRGGFAVPEYLGSKSTFPTGGFGGLTGSFLQTGDFLPIADSSLGSLDEAEKNGLCFRWPIDYPLPQAFIPSYDQEQWVVAALNGPHASPDFLQDQTLQDIWTSSYTVHHATNRLGARLIGPAPKWTRPDGGSAGLHPSNLHDYTYAPGAVNFSGNTPIVLMLDGPSLGGFVCPITVATADLWKVAQATPGEKIRFQQVDYNDASTAFSETAAAWEAVRSNDLEVLYAIADRWNPWWITNTSPKQVPAVLAVLDPAKGDHAEIKVSYRMSGDEHVLIEYGDIDLDLAYRLRVHMLMEELKSRSFIREMCPGVRSLLVRYDRRKIHVHELVSIFNELEKGVLGSIEDASVPSRVINLPLAFNDRWTLEAQEKYMHSVRPGAPYMPSNVEFVRRINGLKSVNDVKSIMTTAEYMVLGLGDVYLGAPCAVPVDPRHRMVTSKYNPARTYTPEGAVGIGGAYMCIYGMDSPGGYQLTGRTLPIWDNYGSVPEENRGAPKSIPWLLRFFDRVKFFPVADDELEKLRTMYRKGEYKIDIRHETFSYKSHLLFCEANKESIADFENKRMSAYDEERRHWEATGEGESNAAAEHATNKKGTSGKTNGSSLSSKRGKRPPFSIPVLASMAATVWAVHVKDGDEVKEGQHLFSLESMKVEIALQAPVSGTVQWLSVSKGDSVSPDHELCIVVSNSDAAMGDSRIDHLRGLYKLGIATPSQVITQALQEARASQGVFSVISSLSACDSAISEFEKDKPQKHTPLHGVPFVVADDIDVAGMETHALCPHIRYKAVRSAPIVDALRAAGAILVGKTNTDQLNMGNTGLEIPGVVLQNPVCEGLVTGGNGPAAVAVKKQIASFAIAIDRNGTSTLAPALCGVMGLKTTEGLLPLSESEISCEATDCIGIYANNALDIRRVLEVCISARDTAQTAVRPVPSSSRELSRSRFCGTRLAICETSAMQAYVDDEHFTPAYEKAVEIIRRLGYVTKDLDLSVFSNVASLLEEAPIHYTRLNGLAETVRRSPQSVLPSVSDRVLAIDEISASALGAALAKLEKYKRTADAGIWSAVDAAVLPVATGSYTVEEASRDIKTANSKLSKFSRLFTAMDLCAVTLHLAPSDSSQIPHGICVIAPAFRESLLLEVASKWQS